MLRLTAVEASALRRASRRWLAQLRWGVRHVQAVPLPGGQRPRGWLRLQLWWVSKKSKELISADKPITIGRIRIRK